MKSCDEMLHDDEKRGDYIMIFDWVMDEIVDSKLHSYTR